MPRATYPIEPDTEVLTGVEPRLPAGPSLLAEEDEHEDVVEERPAPGADDAVRRYLGEIGKVRLLTARQEAELGSRIESGQTELLHTLVAVPMARRALVDLAERVQRGEMPADEGFLAPWRR